METTQTALMKTLDWRGQGLRGPQLHRMLPRITADTSDVSDHVRTIIENIRQDGFAAVQQYTSQFDDVRLDCVLVPEEELARAAAELDPEVRAALELSIERLRSFAMAQLPQDAEVAIAHGATLSFRFSPVNRAGVYVPGGLAAYPSSVVMNVIPALVAGVPEIALASPAQKDNNALPHSLVLAAAHLTGVRTVYALGGAVAIAALAYGIDDEDPNRAVSPVDMITGPGNVYVATAKRLVAGDVGIDSEAGATEIAIIADSSANPAYLAADLISQAEHDERAAAVLITDSAELAEAVQEQLAQQVPPQQNTERILLSLAGVQSGIILVDNLDDAVQVANAYGAEHLEIHTENSAEVAGRITNAGAVFIGAHSPVSLGDYVAGSNHVLPTSGTARFSSGLSTMSFLKSIQFIDYDRDALQQVSEPGQALARAEGLPAHASALEIRAKHNI